MSDDTAPAYTATAYDPDDELKRLLRDALKTLRIEYGAKQAVPELHGIQREYTLTDAVDELSGFETQSGLVLMASLEGYPGLAAAAVLAFSLQYGEPTLVYLDCQTLPDDLGWLDTEYEDLTAEWYTPEAVEAGLPEMRMQSRDASFEADTLDLATVERWARHYLTKHYTGDSP